MDLANDWPKSAKASRKDRAILALLQHASVAKAAEAVGVHPATLWRWLKEPEFKTKLLEAQSATFSQSMRCLQQAAPAAAAALVRTVRNAATPPSTCVRAAESILKVSQQTLHHAVLEGRVAELEAARSEVKPTRTPEGARKSNLSLLVPLLFLLLPLLPWLAARVLAPPLRAPITSLGSIDPRYDPGSVDPYPPQQRPAVDENSTGMSAWYRGGAEPFPFPVQPGGTRMSVEVAFRAKPLPGAAPILLATTLPRLPLLLPKCEARVWMSPDWTGIKLPVPNTYDREPGPIFFCSVARTREISHNDLRLADP